VAEDGKKENVEEVVEEEVVEAIPPVDPEDNTTA